MEVYLHLVTKLPPSDIGGWTPCQWISLEYCLGGTLFQGSRLNSVSTRYSYVFRSPESLWWPTVICFLRSSFANFWTFFSGTTEWISTNVWTKSWISRSLPVCDLMDVAKTSKIKVIFTNVRLYSWVSNSQTIGMIILSLLLPNLWLSSCQKEKQTNPCCSIQLWLSTWPTRKLQKTAMTV